MGLARCFYFGLLHDWSLDEIRVVLLDRPSLSVGPSHNRKVQSFEVEIDGNFDGNIGWIRRRVVAVHDEWSFNKEAIRISFRPRQNEMSFVNKKNALIKQDVPGAAIHGSANVRCTKNLHTKELEWYVDGNLVATTCSPTGKPSNTELVGWSVPDGTEMVPFIAVTKGSCRLTNLALEM